MKRGIWILPMFCIFCGCATTAKESPTGCIQPPPDKSDISDEQALKLAASVPEVVTSGELSASFKQAVKISYQEIKSKEAAQLMWLNAIDCYLQRGKVGEVIAMKMADFVISNYAASKGQGAEVLTMELMQEINKTSYAEAIRARHREFFIKVK